MRPPAPRHVALALALALAACGGSSGGGGGGGGGAEGGGGPPPGGTTTTLPLVPRDATPPIGVTWHIGITENVPRSEMEALYATFVAMNNSLWNVTEGQTRLHAIDMTDGVGPGVTTSQFMFGAGSIDTSNLDIVVWPTAMWDIPAGGAVAAQPGLGRQNRLMALPANAPAFVVLHEAGHMLWDLSWFLGPLLMDEYVDGVQDPACVMESENLPLRWCSDADHVSQFSQPHACWHQILLDYPGFSHLGNDTAPDLPPVPEVVYHDVP